MREKSAKNMDLTENNGTIKLYELGFHILPSVSAEKLSSKVAEIEKILSKHNAKVTSFGEPALIDLAYEMRKSVGGKYEKCKKAYFGWMKLEASPESVVEIKQEIDLLEPVLRYMIINTVVDGEHTTNHLAEEERAKSKKEDQPAVADEASIAPEVLESEPAVADEIPASHDVDQAIDDLIK